MSLAFSLNDFSGFCLGLVLSTRLLGSATCKTGALSVSVGSSSILISRVLGFQIGEFHKMKKVQRLLEVRIYAFSLMYNLAIRVKAITSRGRV